MNKFFHFLAQNKKRNIALLIFYYLLVVLPHEQVGLLTVKIFGALPRDQYNLVIMLLCILAICILGFLLFRKIMEHPQKIKILLYIISTLVFASLCFNYLFVVNIEAIHFVQYAGFAILVFPLIKNYTYTLIYTTLAGAFDEAFQYFYLSNERTDYYDLNDVIINLVGAGFGLIIIKTCYNNSLTALNFKNFVQSKLALILSILILLILVLTISNVIPYAPSKVSLSGFYWYKKIPDSFFTEIPPNVLYHILMPLETFCLFIFFIIFYSRLDK